MTSIYRRHTDQPYNGLNEAQFRIALSGYLLMAAAAAFAVFIFAPAGLLVIGVVSFFIGYLCRSEEDLQMISDAMSERDIYAFGALAIFGSLHLSIAYMVGEQSWRYELLILTTGAFIHVTATLLGEFIRAAWNGFRI